MSRSHAVVHSHQMRGVHRFGSFELNPQDGELRKHGLRLKLQEQPLQILLLLLEHAGDVVTREQIQNKLWPPGTHVDYDNAINSAVRKLRDALGDTSENPRFIETQARRGYRFIGSIEEPAATAPAPAPASGTPPRHWFKPVFASGVAFVAVAIAVVGWLRQHQEASATAVTVVPLSSATGTEKEASFSPDGSQVAYAWDGGDEQSATHIYVKLIGAGTPLRLTSDSRPDRAPAWSPDGRTIAFVRETGSVYLIPALGGAETKLAEGRFDRRSRISWSPNGNFLAVSEYTREPASSLYSIATGNGDKLRLTLPPDAGTVDRNPDFSPVGRVLLFTRCGVHCALYLLDLSPDCRPVGPPRLLRQESGQIFGAAWTTDGKEAVYALSQEAGFNSHLMRVRASPGGDAQPLMFARERALQPVVAPRGNRLAYTYMHDQSEARIWRIQPGRAPQEFAASTRVDHSPQYSPDGKRVAFASDRSGAMEIWASDENGGNPTQLTRFDGRISGTPRWSPDGRWIAFDHSLKGGWRVFVMASDGGQVRRLTAEEAEETIPSWSADGKWVYYNCNRTGREEIWKAPAQGGKGTQVTGNGGLAAFESVDGRSLYYTKLVEDSASRTIHKSPLAYDMQDSGLWVVPLGGGEERRVLESCHFRDFVVVADGIYYVPSSTDARDRSVRFHRFATGEDTEIVQVGAPVIDGLAVSPDRKTILVPVISRSGSNVMLVENFR